MKENKRFKKGMIIAATIGTALGIGGCNIPYGVYGPPLNKESEKSVVSEQRSEEKSDETVSVAESSTEGSLQKPYDSDFDPSGEIPEDVYGPPVIDDEPSVDEESGENEVTEEISEEYDPGDNLPMTVYGPP